MSLSRTGKVALCLVMVATCPTFGLDTGLSTVPSPVASPSPAPRIENLAPAQPSAVVFVNVRRIFAFYGDLINKVPQYNSFRRRAEGLPDPAKDIDQVVLTSDLAKLTRSALGAVVTGSLTMEQAVAFGQKKRISFAPSVYRGVSLLTTTAVGKKLQVGKLSDSALLLSNDDGAAGAGPQEPTKAMVAVYRNEAPGFGQAHAFTLPESYLAALSLTLSPEMRTAIIDSFPAAEPLQPVNFAKAILCARESTKDISLVASFRCDSAEAAKGLLDILKQYLAMGMNHPKASLILSRLKLDREGDEVRVALDLPVLDLQGLR
jgi:hypothetical protein